MLLVALSAALTAGWFFTRPAAEFGDRAEAVAGRSPANVTPARTPAQGPAGTPTQPSTLAPPVPVRLEIPALDVDAPVVPVGVDGEGAMAVPADAADVGWYQWGPAPGTPGRAVLAGHVDTRAQGPGALFELQSVAPAAVVRLTFDDGSTEEFDVTGRRNYGKAELPTEELFARTGSPELVLITCGGDFDYTAGSYEENIVVTASP